MSRPAKPKRPNKYPVYIVSKGRATHQLTHQALSALGIPHHIVVESQEADHYRASAGPATTILPLDPKYQREYDTFDDLGDSKSKGPGAARNFAWDHAIGLGAKRHWVMDDNISTFYRMNFNHTTPAATPAIFRAMEDFADRYENVAMAGPNYFMFGFRRAPKPAYVKNTRIYSCNLILNEVPFRWRGRYNEDTDLSLVMMKAGWCTIQFNAFLQHKAPTQTVPGGNTEDFYAREGTLPKSQMLERMHPDVAKVVFKFGRWHHYVDYSPFKGIPLRRRDGVEVPDRKDDYGMVLKQKKGSRWVPIERPLPEPGTGRRAPKAPGGRRKARSENPARA